MKSPIACALLCVIALPAHTQTEHTLQFIPDRVEFGMIREEDGKVSRKVKAVNVSPDTTFIMSARTSCGCSAAEYTEGLLAPGDTATVTLTYDPLNRPGKFLKTAKFFTGNERTGNSIKMSGTVIPSRQNLDRSYPDKAGQLRLSSGIICAGEVASTEARPMFVGLYNDSDVPLALTAETDGMALEAALMPDTLDAYGTGSVSLMLKGRLLTDKDDDFLYKTYIINTETGDTIASIPVVGSIKKQ